MAPLLTRALERREHAMLSTGSTTTTQHIFLFIDGLGPSLCRPCSPDKHLLHGEKTLDAYITPRTLFRPSTADPKQSISIAVGFWLQMQS